MIYPHLAPSKTTDAPKNFLPLSQTENHRLFGNSRMVWSQDVYKRQEQLAEKLDAFKPSSTEGFEEALKEAKNVYAEENPLKAEVDKAYENLQKAIENLKYRADLSALQTCLLYTSGKHLHSKSNL